VLGHLPKGKGQPREGAAPLSTTPGAACGVPRVRWAWEGAVGPAQEGEDGGQDARERLSRGVQDLAPF